jgi:hypothetical protein
MGEAFHHGGWGMYPTLVVGGLLVGAAAKFALQPERRRMLLVIWMQVLTMLVGTLGFVSGMIKASMAAGDDPEAGKLILVGFGEALNCVGLALALVVLGGAIGAFGLVRSRRAAGTGSSLVDPFA